MSRMPDNLESKYNHDNKFKWVDSQLEKFMERNKELETIIAEKEKILTEFRVTYLNDINDLTQLLNALKKERDTLKDENNKLYKQISSKIKGNLNDM